MKISIFGLGYVGCVSMGCLAQNGHSMIGIDVNPTKVTQINAGKATIIEKDIDGIIREQFVAGRIRATSDFKKAVRETDISIICVGTPSAVTGHLNLDYIYAVAKQIGEGLRSKPEFHIIAVRSTVLPGTAEQISGIIARESGKIRNCGFAVLSNPEFLREGTAVNDYYHPPLTLIGSDNQPAAEKLAEIYRQLPAEIIITETKVAETMKYVNNTYHALKIGFANEVGNICQKLDIDSHKVMDIFVKDRQLNLSPYYFKPGFAYGGSCLPKDLKAFQTLAHDLYVETPIISSIGRTNSLQIKKAIDLVIGLDRKRVGFLGLAFKAGTDDFRNSPTIEMIETLLGKGYNIIIYDKNINISSLTGTNREFIEKHIPHLSEFITDNIANLVQCSDVIVVATQEKEFKETLANLPDKIIVDLVRVNDQLMQKEQYHGICW